MSSSKDTKQLAKRLRAAGWTVEDRKGGHLVAKSPDGRHMVVMSKTPSDHRALANTLAQLRRAGYDDRAHTKKKKGGR